MSTDPAISLIADLNAARDEVARLQRWKDEALPVIFGLQDLGRALDIGLGRSITGPDALEAANRLQGDLAAARDTLARVRAVARETAFVPSDSRMTTPVVHLGLLRRALDDDAARANPDRGPRCGECRLGLGVHDARDPLCAWHSDTLIDPRGSE